ncbi:hypothetical protein AVEN_184751-1 [Araneus ventricosus]|uniref:Uncharacterized protein n=1 Tax=Araneus ventricosus TaxID=182803 RepID=A0A4Y2J1X2_ARAVE|nr:hypothetical protein AVEN_184751-1 [Araneus ventricosus]
MEDNRRKVIIEEHISLVKEPGSEYIGHVSVNFGRAQIIGNNIYSFLSCVGNDKDVVTEHLSTQMSKDVCNMELILNRPLQWFVCQLHIIFSCMWIEPQLGPEA